jgi:hypothetical protein
VFGAMLCWCISGYNVVSPWLSLYQIDLGVLLNESHAIVGFSEVNFVRY